MSGEIVLAIRLGPSSTAPTTVAADLARSMGARILVLYVATEIAPVEVGGAEAGMGPGGEEEGILADAELALRDFIATNLAGLPVSSRVVAGKVEECVADVATELGARFIVVGTRGRSALARLVLGDTVHGILQRTPCPVVVVPLGDTGS
ncbi:MAG TPA: universal stress protein [Longimicrobiales bacterium]|nr:universal stress protein [Longimicrobiales bacterium]